MGDKTIFISPLDEYFDTARDTLGDIRREANSYYKYVQYHGGSGAVDGVDGDAVFYTSDTGYTANEVRQDLTDLAGSTRAIIAGVIQAAIDISDFTTVAYGWIKIKGPEVLSIDPEDSQDSDVAVDGDSFCYGAADGAVRRINTVNVETSILSIGGIIVDDSAKEVILDCPF